MAIARGMSLGPYEILSQIGAGGMGDVWRARDKRIGRDVAVKVLPDAYGADDERVQRFEQEARAAGALNHPGLVTIFDVGTTEGAPYLVMELLEGETLRDVLGHTTATPLPQRRAIDYAIQIASALATAHEKGIIHRDLKPENLFIVSDGRVKILDFGLAKLAGDATDVDGRRRTARHLTASGMVVGTPGYMSPEQVRAHPLDPRTDIFALGTVLYEMLIGHSPFERETAVETMHTILTAEQPSLSALDPRIPPALEAVVAHCLEKNPRDRFQSARDLAFQLRMLPDPHAGGTDGRNAAMPHKSRRLPHRAAIAVLLLLAAAAAGGLAMQRIRAGEEPAERRTFRQLTFADGLELLPTLAPDGKSFAFVSSQSGNRDIYVQRVDGRTAVNVTSDSPEDDSEPAFSPDGSKIAFRSERDGGGIFVMSITGESPRRLTDFGHNPSWAPDGTRLVAATAGMELMPQSRPTMSELWIVDASTGARRPLVQARVGGPDFGRESDALQPSWSPNGKRIAFWGISTWFGQRDIWTIDPDAPQPKRTVVRVTSDPALHWNPVWSPDGKHLYYGSNAGGTLNLWRVRMDQTSGTPAGSPEPLTLPASVSGNFAFSRQGEMTYVTTTRSYRLVAVPFDAKSVRTGAPRTLFGGSEEILTFQPSPDGRMMAYTTGGVVQEDLFVIHCDGTRMLQLTNDAAKDRGPIWSPDGKTLYFYSNRDGDYQHWSIRVDGSGLARITDERGLARIGARNIYTPVVSPDGRTLAAQTERSSALVHLDRPPDRRVEKIPVDLNVPQWSPDGRYLVGAYDSVTFSGPGAGLTLYTVASRKSEKILDRGLAPYWLPDGRRVLFFDEEELGIIDIVTRQVRTARFDPLPGVAVDVTAAMPTLSPDGSTLYMLQTVEQGDIWLVHPGRANS